ncbi:unnamed protein product [Arabidopsis thaliana]|uniref:(thale cress) hypothetical protein n=1 Tax=Arabidopsis thaliana TaxID=3702 RepID=A0A7G2EAR8_ARATH|nr:unnamed protein product [Arabidopsis thaliana]
MSENMVNLPDSLYEDYSKLKLTSPSNASSSSSAPPPRLSVVAHPTVEMIIQWVCDIHKPKSYMSDFALHNLAYHRNDFEFLPSLLWESKNTVYIMLQEVFEAYRHLAGHISLRLFPHPLNPLRVYNSMACHPDTSRQFLRAKMPNYFYPLMDTGLIDKRDECMRLAALGVIAHMLKASEDGAVNRYLMESGVVGFCVKPIEFGSTETKKVALYILDKIMSTDQGLYYCCVLADRFYVIDELLKKVLFYLSNMVRPPSSLFSLVTGCYVKLSQNSRARNGIRRYTPFLLFDGTFSRLYAEDPVAANNRIQLLQNLDN